MASSSCRTRHNSRRGSRADRYRPRLLRGCRSARRQGLRAARDTPAERLRPAAGVRRADAACADRSNVAFDVVVLAKGLEKPWAVEPLPNGDLLVTEKPGQMRIVTAKGDTGADRRRPRRRCARPGRAARCRAVAGFETDNTVYWSYSEPRQGGNATSVARGVLRPIARARGRARDLPRAAGLRRRQALRLAARVRPDGMLYVTLGERSDKPMRPQAQQLDSHMGKIVRIAPDGSVPATTRSSGRRRAAGDLVARPPQRAGCRVRYAGRLWEVEHGTRRRRRAQPHRARQQLRLAGGRLRRGVLGCRSRVR